MDSRITIVLGDITKIPVDAIVNAAKNNLLGGSGVDGAIHAAAGPELLEECETLGGCLTGQVKVTKAYELPAKYVFHTVGPDCRYRFIDDASGNRVRTKPSNEESESLLESCYKTCLDLCEEYDVKSISFPCISTGIYAFPPDKAAAIALSTVNYYLNSNRKIEKVIFACFDKYAYDIYIKMAVLIIKLNSSEIE